MNDYALILALAVTAVDNSKPVDQLDPPCFLAVRSRQIHVPYYNNEGIFILAVGCFPETREKFTRAWNAQENFPVLSRVNFSVARVKVSFCDCSLEMCFPGVFPRWRVKASEEGNLR